MTNLERIQNMNVEEMAEILFSPCTEEIGGNELCYECTQESCSKCVINWLNSEYEVSDSN